MLVAVNDDELRRLSDERDRFKQEYAALESENAKLRESAVLQSAIFKLRDENAKLRKLAVLHSVISKHMSTCPTTDCQVCPVNEECAESVHLEGVLGIDDKETSWLVQWRSEDAADVRAENAKLRELVIDFDKCLDTAIYLAGANGFATMPDQELFDSLRPRMQELGVAL